jgi:hypothetical protein
MLTAVNTSDLVIKLVGIQSTIHLQYSATSIIRTNYSTGASGLSNRSDYCISNKISNLLLKLLNKRIYRWILYYKQRPKDAEV